MVDNAVVRRRSLGKVSVCTDVDFGISGILSLSTSATFSLPALPYTLAASVEVRSCVKGDSEYVCVECIESGDTSRRRLWERAATGGGAGTGSAICTPLAI